MRRVLPFEIFFVLEQVLPKGHKQIFFAQIFPSVGQSGPAILLVWCNVVDIAWPQDWLFHRILEFSCSELRCVLTHQFQLKRELQR